MIYYLFFQAVFSTFVVFFESIKDIQNVIKDRNAKTIADSKRLSIALTICLTGLWLLFFYALRH
jgi:hypothetical protein